MSIPLFYDNLIRDLGRLKRFSNAETRDAVIDEAPELSEIEKAALRSEDKRLIAAASSTGFKTQQPPWP
ncbi:hypothetical protein BH18GEM1_BH18GEM1_21780 [soil metagenome]